jgi:hypothetical protein
MSHGLVLHVEIAFAATVDGAQDDTVDIAHPFIGEGIGAAAACVGMTQDRDSNLACLSRARRSLGESPKPCGENYSRVIRIYFVAAEMRGRLYGTGPCASWRFPCNSRTAGRTSSGSVA